MPAGFDGSESPLDFYLFRSSPIHTPTDNHYMTDTYSQTHSDHFTDLVGIAWQMQASSTPNSLRGVRKQTDDHTDRQTDSQILRYAHGGTATIII